MLNYTSTWWQIIICQFQIIYQESTKIKKIRSIIRVSFKKLYGVSIKTEERCLRICIKINGINLIN